MTIDSLPSELKKRIVVRPDGCWEWTAGLNNGYARFRKKYVHRTVYEALRGTPTESMHHACRNRACVNPAHLVALTLSAHAALHTQTHCKRGHEFTPENTYVRPDTGTKMCRACSQVSARRARAARKARCEAAGHPSRPNGWKCLCGYKRYPVKVLLPSQLKDQP
jgi:hypothetical protein